MEKTVLVTGASGLIGTAVSTLLIEKKYQVIALDLVPTSLKHPLIIKEITNSVEKVDYDQELKGIKVDAIIHCAAHPGGKSIVEPTLDVEVNAFGGMKIFEWAARNNAEVIFLSSSAVYGNQHDHPIKETDHFQPNTIYAVCKQACEHYLRILEEGYGLKWTVLRLFATYGAGHKPSKFQGIINILMTQMLEGQKVVVKGSLDRKRGLVEVQDAARAIVETVENKNARGKILNISHPIPFSIKGIIGVIAESMNKTLNDFEIIEEAGTVGDTFYNYADSSLAKEVLNFEATITLKQGVTKMLKQRLNQGL